MDKERSKTGEQFDLRAFVSDILVFSWGSVLLLLLGFIQSLIIPKYLPVAEYGYWKLFGLYAGYVGILHLGFIDGILVRWAGKELNQVGREIGLALKFLLPQQLITIGLLALVFHFLLAGRQPFEWISLMVLASALIVNLSTLFMFTAQAVKKFKGLVVLNICIQLGFLLVILSLFTLGLLHYTHVIYGYLLSGILGLIILGFWFRDYLWGARYPLPLLFAYGKENIAIGIFVMSGNFISMLVFSVDRLMVSSFFPIEEFALYGFAVAMAMLAYAVIRPVAKVVFPYLSGSLPQLRARAYQLAKPAIILSWAVALIVYFPLSKLVKFYLPQYVDSLIIVQLLLCAVGFGSLIQILHTNYYKVHRKQREYFQWGITTLVISIILNLLAINLWGTLASVAVATVVSFAIWCIINEVRLKPVVGGNNQQLAKHFIAIWCYMAVFWLSSLLVSGFIMQMLIYIGFFSLVTWLLLRPEVGELVVLAKEFRSWRH